MVPDARRCTRPGLPTVVTHFGSPLVLVFSVLEFGLAILGLAELRVFELLRVRLEFEFAA